MFFDSLDGEDGDEAILEALGEHRIRLQSSIAKQIRAKKTPILDFRPDLVIRSAERIDAILRSDRDRLEREQESPDVASTNRTTVDRPTTSREADLMARRRPATTHGLAIVDKPAGVTSHDVVGMLRRRFGERQVGHGGTLDPDATGVLVVAVGMTTRLLRFVERTQKEYVGEVVLGAETNTLDAAGEVTATFDMSGVTVDDARRVVAEHLTGPIRQIPPMVSAIRVDGKRLHELAREGIEIEREPRPVVVDRFDVWPTDDPLVLRIEVECSAGTYIRSLAADLGTLLGGGAHLRALRRTRVGSFTHRRRRRTRTSVCCCRSTPPCARSRGSRSTTRRRR